MLNNQRLHQERRRPSTTSRDALFFVVLLVVFLSLSHQSLAEEIIVEITPPEPQRIELARIDTAFRADIEVAYPLPIEALVLVTLSEEEAYIERLQVRAEGDQRQPCMPKAIRGFEHG